MVLTSAFLLNDLEFLTQLNYPEELLITGKVQFFFERVQTTWRLLNAEMSQPMFGLQQARLSSEATGLETLAAAPASAGRTALTLAETPFPPGSTGHTLLEVTPVGMDVQADHVTGGSMRAPSSAGVILGDQATSAHHLNTSYPAPPNPIRPVPPHLVPAVSSQLSVRNYSDLFGSLFATVGRCWQAWQSTQAHPARIHFCLRAACASSKPNGCRP